MGLLVHHRQITTVVFAGARLLVYLFYTYLSQDGGLLPRGDPDGLRIAAARARRRVTRRGGTGRTLLPRSARLADQKRALERSIPLPSVNRQNPAGGFNSHWQPLLWGSLGGNTGQCHHLHYKKNLLARLMDLN